MLSTTVWPLGSSARAVPMLRAIRPHAVNLHGTPAELEAHAPALARAIRADRALARAGAPPELWVTFAQVGYGAASRALRPLVARGDAAGIARVTDGLLADRMRAVEVARVLGARTFMLDLEFSFKSKLPGFDGAAARAAIAAARERLGPGVRVLVTSYGAPHYHRLPWDAFDAGDGHAAQWYAAPKQVKGEPPRIASLDSARELLAMYAGQWRELAARGVVRDRPMAVVYVQGHHVCTEGTCAIADAGTDVGVWAAPTRLDAAGVRAARALVGIEDAGFTGPGRIARWQAARGLKADGIVGPKSLAALGIE